MREDAIDNIRRWSDEDLQSDYMDLLRTCAGKIVNGRVLIYGAEDVVERNRTFETKKYCAGYFALGDDSGGRAIVTNLGKVTGPIFIVDQGSMSEDDFIQIASDMQTWLRQGCPID
ncbi:SMI1/KNR4 family protein [Duganella sp. CY15W]|uniref:SMI1/KNR4 family protein n=1 Tax=Duganella sp. CY15W TaxID=2692172 RepID=UPI00137082E0|nr:SMI1/KNR4 family protein [Duganella sp. CY15W]MYM27450.1 SMI1/KNR4 family protein [Duganella sp. CY15W]